MEKGDWTTQGKAGTGRGAGDPVARQHSRWIHRRLQAEEVLFEGLKRGPADLDYLTREMIKPALKKAQVPWHGWHAFRRGLATNLHRLGVPDIVIQAMLRHSIPV